MEKIDTENFEKYLQNVLGSKIIYSEPFNDMLCVVIDCFPENSKYHLVIHFSKDDIKFGIITKEPMLDFSPFEYEFENNKKAEDFVKQIIKSGWPKSIE